jgi:hypothetical protein
MGQANTLQTPAGNTTNFNKAIHVDTFSTTKTPKKVIITITDDSKAFSVSTIATDNSTASTITALKNHWFRTYGYTKTISFKQGKVQACKLEKRINDLAPLDQEVTCKRRMKHIQQQGWATMDTKSAGDLRGRVHQHHQFFPRIPEAGTGNKMERHRFEVLREHRDAARHRWGLGEWGLTLRILTISASINKPVIWKEKPLACAGTLNFNDGGSKQGLTNSFEVHNQKQLNLRN